MLEWVSLCDAAEETSAGTVTRRKWVEVDGKCRAGNWSCRSMVWMDGCKMHNVNVK
jgi:hypothetical protein